MKQVVVSPRSGVLRVMDVPAPRVRPGAVLVQNAASVVSAGTERMVIALAGKSLLGKARARPDLVREVLNKVRRDGLRTTVRESLLRLDRPHPLGYSSAGTVIEVSPDVQGIRTGDRAACAGAGWAAHAEVIVVPQHLCVPLPPEVSWEAGAFTMLGAIALHGIYRAGAGLGDIVAVLGLGVVGQLTVQLLRSAGCRVLAHDISAERAALAARLGADAAAITDGEARAAARRLSGDAGVDAVIVTAATESNAPLELAAEIARVRGTVVMVGVTGMRVPRRPFWQKELALLLSRAAGPGSGDEEDNPPEVVPESVRSTAGRNMAAFVAEVARGAVRVEPLVSHRFPIERADDAYSLIRGHAGEPHLGVVLMYPHRPATAQTIALRAPGTIARESAPSESLRAVHGAARDALLGVGVIGGGLFAQTVLLPVLRRVPGVRLRGIATATGTSARHAGDRFGFEFCTTDASAIIGDDRVTAVVIATRHDLHAPLVIEALRAGKHVFVEKPLGLTPEEIGAVLAAYRASPRVLVVGFNRRYSPLAQQVKTFIARERPLAFMYRINAGAVPPDHWVYDPVEGGGRWLGEGGHFVDLLQYLTDADPVQVFARSAAAGGVSGGTSVESLAISLAFGDGSTATILYADGADRAESRERLEVFGRGLACTLEDFRRATLVRGGRVRRIRRWEAARGYPEELRAWVAAVRGEAHAPVPVAAYAANAVCCFAVLESVRAGVPVNVDPSALVSEEPGVDAK